MQVDSGTLLAHACFPNAQIVRAEVYLVKSAHASFPNTREMPPIQHTSAYFSIRQHTSAYVSICNTSAYVCNLISKLQRNATDSVLSLLTRATQLTRFTGTKIPILKRMDSKHQRNAPHSAYVSICQHTSAYVSIRLQPVFQTAEKCPRFCMP
jgi:hypothetical protein